MAKTTARKTAATDTPSAKPGFNEQSGGTAARKSDWSKKFTFGGRSYDILPPVEISIGEPVIRKWPAKERSAREKAMYEEHARKLQMNAMKAALILSQTIEGRANLETLNEQGYKVVFDTARCKEHKALGLCSFTEKEIVLSERIDSLARLALVLNHEAAHARLGQSIITDASIRLEDQMLVVNTHEAHARASEVKVSLELMVGNRNGPDTQLRSPVFMDDFKERHPDIAKPAIATAAKAGDVHDGRAMAAAFVAYFSQEKLRADYEEHHTGWLGDLQVAVLKNKKTHRKKVDKKKLKSMLKDGPVAYLDTHCPNLDLAAPRFSGVSSEHHAKFHEAWKRFMRHAPINMVLPPHIAVYPPVPQKGFIDTLKDALAKRQKKQAVPKPGHTLKPN